MNPDKNLASNTPATAIQMTNVLPNLHKMSVGQIDLTSNYWSPSSPADSKRAIVLGVENSQYPDEKTGEMIPLKCVIFIEQLPDLSLTKWRNGACKLVNCIENSITNGVISPGKTAVRLEYLGKTKTKSGHFIDNFSVKLLKAEAADDAEPN